MPYRYDKPFYPVPNTTAPSFESAGSLTSSANELQSTALGRQWFGPSGRSVRLTESSGLDYHVNFGSSLIVAASSDSILVLGGVSEVFTIDPSVTYVAIKSVSTSTAAAVNITLGYGR